MKAYVMTTGTIFGLIVVAHVLRVIDEGTHLLREPSWVSLTLAAAALCAWSWRVLGRIPRS
jgi:hypothetical protein